MMARLRLGIFFAQNVAAVVIDSSFMEGGENETELMNLRARVAELEKALHEQSELHAVELKRNESEWQQHMNNFANNVQKSFREQRERHAMELKRRDEEWQRHIDNIGTYLTHFVAISDENEALRFLRNLPACIVNTILCNRKQHWGNLMKKWDHKIKLYPRIDANSFLNVLSKITIDNLGIGPRTLLLMLTGDANSNIFRGDNITFLSTVRANKLELVKSLLDKMKPDDLLIQEDDEDKCEGTAFHVSCWNWLDMAKLFARHKNVNVAHFLVGSANTFEGNISHTKYKTPIMKCMNDDNTYQAVDFRIAKVVLKCFVDKFCFRLKKLRKTCKFFNHAFSQKYSELPQTNKQGLLFSLPRDAFLIMMKYVAMNRVSHNRCGDNILPDHSINLIDNNVDAEMNLTKVLHVVVDEAAEEGYRGWNAYDELQCKKAEPKMSTTIAARMYMVNGIRIQKKKKSLCINIDSMVSQNKKTLIANTLKKS